MSQVNGTPVNFGFGAGAGIAITELAGTMLLQSADATSAADHEVTRDGDGSEVTHGWYNATTSGTLEYVVTGATLAAAIVNSALVAPGSFVTITGCAKMPSLVGKWEVQAGCKLSGTNTTSKKISLPLRYLPLIQGPAS